MKAQKNSKMNRRKKKLLYAELQNKTYDRSTAPPIHKKRRTATTRLQKEKPAASILSLPPEVLESILFRLSVSDVLSFGSTCHYFRELSLSQLVWKNLFFQNLICPTSNNNEETNWRRQTILKMSQDLVLQRLSSSCGDGGISWHRSRGRQLTVTRSLNIPMALGLRRVVPILDHTLLWDYNGTIFILFTPRGNVIWKRPCGYSVLCYNAKDFAVDPRSNLMFRRYIYVLVSYDVSGNHPEHMGPLRSIPHPSYDCVDVFKWDTQQKVFHMIFHFSLSFTQLRLTGLESNRSLTLLTDTGKVYALCINETQLSTPHTYTVQMSLKSINRTDLPIKQVHTSLNSVLYITADGSVFAEVQSPGTYRQLFGTTEGYIPPGVQTVVPIPLPYKVVKCSLGPLHLCLLDNCGRVFMQGSNRYGQLGTGDKIDRGEPTLVVMSMAPVDVWCGLNHTLVLLEAESGDKQVQGCGCASGGRLPGCLEGSPVFVRLNVKVPRAATSLCSTKECLFLLCCHDIAEPRVPCYIPPTTEDEKDLERRLEEEKERLLLHLTQMKRCDSANTQIVMLQSTVRQHLPGLSPVHKAFLDTALTIILNQSKQDSKT